MAPPDPRAQARRLGGAARGGERSHRPRPGLEARRQRVLELLEAHPAATYAAVTDMDADPAEVIIALAIREQATFELRIPRERYDGTLLLDLIEKHGGTVH